MLHDIQEELRNDNPNVKWQEDDRCFSYSGKDRSIFSGTILGMYPEDGEMFRSQVEIDAAIRAVRARDFETDVAEYMGMMPGKDGPFAFALAHDLTEHGAETDRAARYAFAARVKDLFGVRLDI